MTVLVLDNATVAMTGGQPTYASGSGLEQMVAGLGVNKEHIKSIIPLPKNHEKNAKVLKNEFEYEGLSVVIATRECVQEMRRKKRSG
jgi:indolepyruvate ferredoxin oxidoreductase alpha subunit